MDDCVICGKDASSDSMGVPLCSCKDCIKEWFAFSYIERVNLIAEYQDRKGDDD